MDSKNRVLKTLNPCLTIGCYLLKALLSWSAINFSNCFDYLIFDS